LRRHGTSRSAPARFAVACHASRVRFVLSLPAALPSGAALVPSLAAAAFGTPPKAIRQNPPRTKKRTSSSGSTPEQSKKQAMRPSRSIRRCCCMQERETCSAAAADCCRTLAGGCHVLPVAVPTFQFVAKVHLLRCNKTQRRVFNLQITQQRRQAPVRNGGRIVSLVVSRNLLDLHRRRNLVKGKMTRINNAHATHGREPQSPVRGLG